MKALKDLNTNTLLPIHWAVFDLAFHPWNESINIIADLCEKSNIKLLTPKIGEKFDLNKQMDFWWRD